MSAETELRAWITDRDRRPELPLDEHTALFTDRRLTSLDLPELIMLVERLGRRTITVDEISAANFASMATITAGFLR